MQQIVKEPVRGIPHRVAVLANSVHGISDPDEMFQETIGDLLIQRIRFRQDERDLQHVLAIESHPGSAVCLIEMPAGWEFGTAVEDPNVVQSEKSARENILALRILAVDPPVEIQHQSLKRTFQEAQIRSAQLSLHQEQEQCRPGMNRWVDVPKIPFVRGNLSIWMRVQIAQHQQELFFGKIE